MNLSYPQKSNISLFNIFKVCSLALIMLLGFTQCKTHKSNVENKNTYKYSNVDEVINYASKFTGIKYKYAGKTPQTGFDCSGFVSYVYKKIDLNLPSSSSQLAETGKETTFKNIKKGDLMFFTGSNKNNRKVGHVALVTENKSGTIKIIHATTSRGVISETYNSSKYWTERYLFARKVISY